MPTRNLLGGPAPARYMGAHKHREHFGPLPTSQSAWTKELKRLWKIASKSKSHKELIELRTELGRLVAATSRRSQELRNEEEGVSDVNHYWRWKR